MVRTQLSLPRAQVQSLVREESAIRVAQPKKNDGDLDCISHNSLLSFLTLQLMRIKKNEIPKLQCHFQLEAPNTTNHLPGP